MATCTLDNPAACLSYGNWIQTFPLTAVADFDEILAAGIPPALLELVTNPFNASGALPDCADVAFLLRHHYLKARGKTFSFKVGRNLATAVTFSLGAGVTDKQVRACLDGAGTVSFQEMRNSFALVNFHRDHNEPILNLNDLLAVGLQPGDMFVWKKRPDILTSTFQGHAQTVQAVLPPVFDANNDLITEGTIVLLQGNMEGGKGKGQLQQRVYTFSDLTKRDDGEDRIVFEPRFGEEFFIGAGRWRG